MSVAAGEPAFQNGAVKGAILMLSLGYEQSAELLKLISDEQVQQITEAIASLDEITVEQTESVLSEFIHLSGYGPTTRGGFGRARRLLTAAFGQEGGKQKVERLPRAPVQRAGGLAYLESTEPELLAERALDALEPVDGGGEGGQPRSRRLRLRARHAGPPLERSTGAVDQLVAGQRFGLRGGPQLAAGAADRQRHRQGDAPGVERRRTAD